MNENEAKTIAEKIKELIRQGNVSRVVVAKEGKELVNIPVTAGVLGGAAMLVGAKWVLLMGVLATVGFGCTVSVVKDDGKVVEVLKEGDAQKVREAAANVAKDVKDAVIGKAADFEEVVDQFEEQAEEAAEAAEEVVEEAFGEENRDSWE